MTFHTAAPQLPTQRHDEKNELAERAMMCLLLGYSFNIASPCCKRWVIFYRDDLGHLYIRQTFVAFLWEGYLRAEVETQKNTIGTTKIGNTTAAC